MLVIGASVPLLATYHQVLKEINTSKAKRNLTLPWTPYERIVTSGHKVLKWTLASNADVGVPLSAVYTRAEPLDKILATRLSSVAGVILH